MVHYTQIDQGAGAPARSGSRARVGGGDYRDCRRAGITSVLLVMMLRAARFLAMARDGSFRAISSARSIRVPHAPEARSRSAFSSVPRGFLPRRCCT